MRGDAVTIAETASGRAGRRTTVTVLEGLEVRARRAVTATEDGPFGGTRFLRVAPLGDGRAVLLDRVLDLGRVRVRVVSATEDRVLDAAPGIDPRILRSAPPVRYRRAGSPVPVVP